MKLESVQEIYPGFMMRVYSLHLHASIRISWSLFGSVARRAYSKKQIGKLVRDKIPEIIKKSGKECELRMLGGLHKDQALEDKLVEEVDELRNAKDNEHWLEEMADIQEVMLGLLKSKGYKLADLERVRKEKRIERGGFERGIYLIKTMD